MKRQQLEAILYGGFTLTLTVSGIYLTHTGLGSWLDGWTSFPRWQESLVLMPIYGGFITLYAYGVYYLLKSTSAPDD